MRIFFSYILAVTDEDIGSGFRRALIPESRRCEEHERHEKLLASGGLWRRWIRFRADQAGIPGVDAEDRTDKRFLWLTGIVLTMWITLMVTILVKI